MSKNLYHLDANESAFFERELTSVKKAAFNAKRKNLKAVDLIPVASDTDPGAEHIAFHTYDGVGVAKVISDYANDLPVADVYGKEHISPVRSIGMKYMYNVQEIRKAAMANRPLNPRKAEQTRRAVDELIDKIAWFGDADNGLNGLLNYPGITESTVALNVGNTSKNWKNKTADEIVKDVSAILAAVIEPTNGREIPNTLLLPLSCYNLIKDKRMPDGNDKTVLTFIKESNPGLTIDWLTELETAGDSGKTRMLAYVRDPMNLTLEIPLQFEQYPPQQTDLVFSVPCHATTGGVIVYYPQSVAFGDDI